MHFINRLTNQSKIICKNFSGNNFILTYIWLSILFFLLVVWFWTIAFFFFLESSVKIISSIYFFIFLAIVQETILLSTIYFSAPKYNRKNKIKDLFQLFFYKDITFLKTLLVLIISFIFILFMEYLMNLNIPYLSWDFTSDQKDTIDFLKSLTLIPALILWGILIPFVEEIVFRWFLTSFFLHKKYSIIITTIFSAFLFSIVHMQVWVIFPLFLTWVFLSIIYYKTGNLFYSFLAHVLNNSLSILIIFWYNIYLLN